MAILSLERKMLKTGPCTVMKTTSKDDDEINHLHISLSKKCDKVHAGEIRSMNCGDGEDRGTLEDCGCDTKPSNCSDCTALCTGQHGNKLHSQYICPDNGVTEMFYDKCKKLSNKQLSFASGENSGPSCNFQDDMANYLIGDSATLEKIFCDDDGDGAFTHERFYDPKRFYGNNFYVYFIGEQDGLVSYRNTTKAVGVTLWECPVGLALQRRQKFSSQIKNMTFGYTYKYDGTNDEHLHVKTPLIESPKLSKLTGRQILLKLDNLQPGGSFKIRGIGHLVQFGKANGKLSAGGNAGLAAAIACNKMGMKCTVIVPGSTPKSAADNIREHGATVECFGNVWDDADEEARRRLTDNSVLYISPFDHPKIWEGHSSMIDELKLELKGETPSLVVCSVGGGGLLLGVLDGLRKNNWAQVPVLAMETYGAESLNVSLNAGKVVRLDNISSIAKSLGSKQIAQAALDQSLKHPGKVYSQVCHDTETIHALENFLAHHRHFVEPACAATLAAGYFPKYLETIPVGAGPVVMIVCGGSAVSLDLINVWKENAKS